jgi:hypothetical protein
MSVTSYLFVTIVPPSQFPVFNNTYMNMLEAMQFGRYSCKFLDALVQDERGRLDCCIRIGDMIRWSMLDVMKLLHHTMGRI